MIETKKVMRSKILAACCKLREAVDALDEVLENAGRK